MFDVFFLNVLNKMREKGCSNSVIEGVVGLETKDHLFDTQEEENDRAPPEYYLKKP